MSLCDFKKNLKCNLKYLFILGFLLGGIFFIAIYGVNVINFTYDSWLFNKGDLSTNYIGWLYYRKSELQFPIGLVEGILTPSKVSIIYTDSIPLFAVFFKLLSPILPSTFQYFGLWGLLSFSLMGGLSSILLKKFLDNNWLCLILSSFFIVSPYVLQRMFGHTALAGQWIIILAIILWIYDPYKNRKRLKIISWCLFVFIVTSVHLYFLPMIFIFMGLSCLQELIRNKKESLLFIISLFFCTVLTAFVTLWIYGAFSGSAGEFSAGGLGMYSANLNTFFNSQGNYSIILNRLPNDFYQYEGLGYLGIGIIGLSLISLYKLVCKDEIVLTEYKKSDIIIALMGFLAFIVLALSPVIKLGNKTLFIIPWPPIIKYILAIFRASGRFIWPACYMIFLGVIIIVFKNKNKNRILIFATLMCCIQIYDLSGQINDIRSRFSDKTEYITDINTKAWDTLLQNKKHIVFIPYDTNYNAGSKATEISLYAAKKNIDINFYLVARFNPDDVMRNTSKCLQKLQNGISRDDTVYIFKDEITVWNKGYNLNFYKIDDLYIGLKTDVKGLTKIKGVEKYNSQTQDFLINMDDVFLNQESEENNQDHTEKIIIPNGVMYGPYYPMKKGNYKLRIQGENLDNANLNIASYKDNENGFEYNWIINESNQIEVQFTITKDIENMEVVITNNKEQNIKVYSMQLHVE